jgi:hypothetical protein
VEFPIASGGTLDNSATGGATVAGIGIFHIEKLPFSSTNWLNGMQQKAMCAEMTPFRRKWHAGSGSLFERKGNRYITDWHRLEGMSLNQQLTEKAQDSIFNGITTQTRMDGIAFGRA